MTNGNFVTGTNTDSVPLVAGETVRVSTTDKSVVRARASSPAGVAGLLGIVISGVVNPGGVANVCITGSVPVLLDTGLTPATGDALYVSAITAGHASTVQAGPAIGTVFSASRYTSDSSVVGVIGTFGSGTATGDAGFQRSRIAGMAAISTKAFSADVVYVCRVLSVGDSYTFVANGTLVVDEITVVAADDGGGQWCRMGVQNQAWLAAPFWAIKEFADISGPAGDDENVGSGATAEDAAAAPLATMAELERRQIGQRLRSTLSIQQIGPISADKITPLTNIATADGNGVPYWYGKKVLLFSGAVTNYAPAVPSSNTGSMLIVNSLSGTWSNSGTGGASLVGCVVESADGTRAALVQKDLGGKLARVTQPNDSSGIGFSVGTAAVFTNGETIKVYSLPALPGYPFAPNVNFPVIEYVDLSAGGLFNLFLTGGSDTTWSRCVFRGAGGGADTGVVLVSDNHGSFLTCSFTDGQVQIWGSGTQLLYWSGIRDGSIASESGILAPESPIDIQHGSLSTTRGGLVFAGTSTLGVFDCTVAALSVADEATLGRSIRFRGNGDTSQPIYGTGNTAEIVSLPAGTTATLPPASAITAVTTAVHPLLVAGVGYALGAIPFLDTTAAGANNGVGGVVGSGGVRAANIAAMTALPTGALSPITQNVVWVETVGDEYEFVPGGTLVADGITVANADDGGGQWVRRGVVNQLFLQKLFWCINSVDGSDEAQGWGVDQANAEANALKTFAELNRRQVGQIFDSATNMLRIGIVHDIPLTDNAPLTNIKSAGFFFYPNLIGKRTQVGGDYTITAYAAENPVANTGFLVTAVGLNSSFVDLLMQTADGTKSAIVQASAGANQIRVVQPTTSDAETGSLGNTTNFAVNDVVRFFRLPRVPRIPWTGDSGGYGLAWVRHGYGYAAQGDVSYLGGISLFGVQNVSEGDHILGGVSCSWTCEGFRAGADTSPTLLYQHTAFGFAVGVRGAGLFLLKNTDFEPSCLDIEAGRVDVESSRLVLGGGFNLSVFDCPGDAVSVRVYSEITMQGAGNVYGKDNHGAIVKFEQKTAGVMYPIVGLTATTSVAQPLVINGVGVAYASLPYADPVTLTGVSVWA